MASLSLRRLLLLFVYSLTNQSIKLCREILLLGIRYALHTHKILFFTFPTTHWTMGS